MKLKEYPISIKESIKLLRYSSHSLKQKNGKEIELIVSFTSIPSRLKAVNLVVRSLLLQSLRPSKILLWLHRDLRDQVPKNVTRLEGDIFEIRYTPTQSSHSKLVHTLKEFPGSTIVTCDDDLMYPDNWLEDLYREHLSFPKQVLCNRCNMIAYDSNGNTLPYKDWVRGIPGGTSSMSIMPAGYGGVLYPPKCMLPIVTDDNLYFQLAPKADDLWFKAMSFLKGTPSRRIANPSSDFIPIIGTRKYTLATSNIKQDGNRTQWDALRNHFNFKTPDPKL